MNAATATRLLNDMRLPAEQDRYYRERIRGASPVEMGQIYRELKQKASGIPQHKG